MKLSRGFVPTLRDAPGDAEVVSHKLLARAGFIRKVALGIYDFLPLAVRSLEKISRIVREELDGIGCHEVSLPHLIPAEFWQESGRWQKYGKELLRIEDRHEREYCFGPTHEEVICDLVRGELRSYRDLPKHLYQIQTKFRDEIRPRFGLLRGREFIMKDSYSFHATIADLDKEYETTHAAYLRIFERCGLACRAVEADTGSIGGNSSHEFMVLADTGEDVIAMCDACQYAANLEKAVTPVPAAAQKIAGAPQAVATPKTTSIADVAALLKLPTKLVLKSLVYKADDRFALVCVAGDRDVNDVKLKKALAADEIRMATDAEITQHIGAPVGFIGPIGLKLADNVEVLYDPSALAIAGGAAGANKADEHLIDVNAARDFIPGKTVDVASVILGDACPKCSNGKLSLTRGIEVGHIFKLGTRYSEPMKVKFLDEDGLQQTAIMGTYGIGVSRVMAACVEQNHDDKGILWPKALAPYSIGVLSLGNDAPVLATAEKLHDDLCKTGFDVLWDDRDERPGVKFNDADLVGYPLQVLIGKKGLDAGQVEYKIRRTGEKGHVPLDGAATALAAIWQKI